MKVPKNLTTRLSEDVWEIAVDQAAEQGLATPRQAIERIVRLHGTSDDSDQTKQSDGQDNEHQSP